ncbi:molybdopterin molybdotransferase, partial [Xenorhabdus bovienii]|nr:molybdopterin molybdotransferase [Xenorhabdus bovienii]
MDHCHISGLISLEQALEKLLAQTVPLTSTETINLTESTGRIIATDIISPINVPPFDNSAMDGYAIRLADFNENQTLPVAGKA